MKNSTEVTRIRLEEQDLKDAREIAKATGIKLTDVLRICIKQGLKKLRVKKSNPLIS